MAIHGVSMVLIVLAIPLAIFPAQLVRFHEALKTSNPNVQNTEITVTDWRVLAIRAVGLTLIAVGLGLILRYYAPGIGF